MQKTPLRMQLRRITLLQTPLRVQKIVFSECPENCIYALHQIWFTILTTTGFYIVPKGIKGHSIVDMPSLGIQTIPSLGSV